LRTRPDKTATATQKPFASFLQKRRIFLHLILPQSFRTGVRAVEDFSECLGIADAEGWLSGLGKSCGPPNCGWHAGAADA
jgi:hypothetical protein